MIEVYLKVIDLQQKMTETEIQQCPKFVLSFFCCALILSVVFAVDLFTRTCCFGFTVTGGLVLVSPTKKGRGKCSHPPTWDDTTLFT